MSMIFPYSNQAKALIAFETGEIFHGYSISIESEQTGEIVFNTSISGYQEILTDPSYYKQAITFTYPEIGNYGILKEAFESPKVHAIAAIMKNYNDFNNHYKSKQSLCNFLKKHQVIGITGVDTRQITRIIRTGGAKKVYIATESFFTSDNEAIEKAKNSIDISKVDLINEVTTSKSYFYNINNDFNNFSTKKKVKNTVCQYKVAVIDCGIKQSILRDLQQYNFLIQVFPSYANHEEIQAFKPDGLFISNGPGNPSLCISLIKTIIYFKGKIPVFGICFGHQLLCQAYGMSIFKMKFGHHGANHPVHRNAIKKKKEINENQVEITSQNHGFAVKLTNQTDKRLKITHINGNDESIAGVEIPEDYSFSVQYHPEASPGPHDSKYLFDKFHQNIINFKLKNAKKK